MTSKDKIEQINNFLDCIAKNNDICIYNVIHKMELHKFNTNDLENTYKLFQENIYANDSYSDKRIIPELIDFLNNLQLSKIELNELFATRNMYETFSSWFIKSIESKNIYNIKVRNSILQLLNELFILDKHIFQFFNKNNAENAQFYIIKDEPRNLMTGHYWELNSFHLFIVLGKDVYMFSFCYYF